MKQLVVILLFIHASTLAQKGQQRFADYIQPAVFSLSKVMMHDVVNPPAASRYYAYCMLGAYELVSQNNSAVPNASLFIHHYNEITKGFEKVYDYKIAAIYCILETGKQLLPSGYLLEAEEENFIKQLKKRKVSQSTIDASLFVAKQMAAHVISFSKTDHYNQLSAKLRYTPEKEEGYWFPTPPMYIEAVEPNWKLIRPLVIDSCNQFMTHRPVPFSKDSSSEFYKLAKEVYDVSKSATPEELEMASFWDCNPFAVETSGHLSLGFKKISPGGHWMNIAGIASQKANLNFDRDYNAANFCRCCLNGCFYQLLG